jgi:hypothetical protein
MSQPLKLCHLELFFITWLDGHLGSYETLFTTKYVFTNK